MVKSPYAHALVRVVDPPWFVLSRALDHLDGLRAFVPTSPGQERLWTEVSWAHPLDTSLEAPDVGMVLMTREGPWWRISDGDWLDIDQLVVPTGLGAATQVVPKLDAPQVQVTLTLARAARPEAPTLFVLPVGQGAVEALVRSTPEAQLENILFVVSGRAGGAARAARSRGQLRRAARRGVLAGAGHAQPVRPRHAHRGAAAAPRSAAHLARAGSRSDHLARAHGRTASAAARCWRPPSARSPSGSTTSSTAPPRRCRRGRAPPPSTSSPSWRWKTRTPPRGKRKRKTCSAGPRATGASRGRPPPAKRSRPRRRAPPCRWWPSSCPAASPRPRPWWRGKRRPSSSSKPPPTPPRAAPPGCAWPRCTRACSAPATRAWPGPTRSGKQGPKTRCAWPGAGRTPRACGWKGCSRSPRRTWSRPAARWPTCSPPRWRTTRASRPASPTGSPSSIVSATISTCAATGWAGWPSPASPAETPSGWRAPGIGCWPGCRPGSRSIATCRGCCG